MAATTSSSQPTRTARRSRAPLAGLRAYWQQLLKDMFSSYRPERHYMRGPGPAWHAKHGDRPYV